MVLNADWRGVPGSASLAELSDLAAWVHHAPYLLPSGRVAEPEEVRPTGCEAHRL